MAEAAAVSIASSILEIVIQKLGSGLWKEMGFASSVKKDVENLQSVLITIKDVLYDAESRSISDKALHGWLRKLRDAAFDADDVVDEFQTEALRQKIEENNCIIRKVKNENKVEQIKSTVALPFHHFSGGEKLSEVSPEVNLNHRRVENQQQCTGYVTEMMKLEEVIPLENEPDNSLSAADSLKADDSRKHREWFPPLQENGSGGSFQSESDNAEGLASSLDLSSSFEKCFQSINERRSSHQNHKPSQEPEVNYQLKPFDYAAARKNMKFGEVGEKDIAESDNRLQTSSVSGEMHKGLASGQSRGEEKVKGFQHPRRRQAFPPSGNRSTTYH